MKFRIPLLIFVLTGIAFWVVACNTPSGPKPPLFSPDSPFTVGSVAFPNDTVYQRANLTPTLNPRVKKFLDKCAAGSDLTIGFIGGSITEGAITTHPSGRYSSLLTSWLRTACPSSKSVREVNAGVSATNSRFAASRVAVDLLAHAPDLVVIEFAVNDYISGDDDFIRAALEGLVRQSLAHDPELAVMLLFTAKGDGNNVQNLHIQIGNHYGLPMISYRDAIWPLVESGRLAWADVFHDDPHPNDNGHRIAAHLLYNFLMQAVGMPTEGSTALPEPYQSDLYQKAGILTSGDTSVGAVLDGWTATLGTHNRTGFGTNTADTAILTLNTRHREVMLGFRMRPTNTSTIYLWVDDELTMVLDNYYVIEYTRFIRIFSDEIGRERTIRIRHTGSAPFLVDYVLYAE